MPMKGWTCCWGGYGALGTEEVAFPHPRHVLDQDLKQRMSALARHDTVENTSELLVNLSGESFKQPGSTISFRRVEPISPHDASKLGWTESRMMLEEALEINKNVVGMDMLTDAERLSQRLLHLGLSLDVQAGDGNCQFRALAKQIFGDPEKHDIVRRRAVGYIANHRARFEPYLGKQYLDKYLAEMAKLGTWGDELTLRAASESFECMISVITSERMNWFVRYIPDKSVRGEVFLAYSSPVHYNAIRRKGKLIS